MAKEGRFRKPEFQAKLARARGYERRTGQFFTWPLFLFIIVILAIFYYLAVSPRFLAAFAPQESVQDALSRLQRQRVFYVIPKNHILFLNKQNLLAEIQKQQPQVRTIRVFKKHWPNRIDVVLEERQSQYVWQSAQNFYVFDQDGVVFQKIPDYTPETFSRILIIDSSADPVEIGESLPITSVLEFIEKLREQWRALINQTDYAHFSIPGEKSQDIIAKTALGFSVYFDLGRDVRSQLESLKLVLNREILPETYNGLSYIDLRLEHMAYYCYRDAPCAPEYATSTPPNI